MQNKETRRRAEGYPVGISRRCSVLAKLEWLGYHFAL